MKLRLEEFKNSHCNDYIKFHRQGIGRELFNKVKSLNSRGFFTVNSSPYAHEIYRHLGFVDTNIEQCINGLKYYPMRSDFK